VCHANVGNVSAAIDQGQIHPEDIQWQGLADYRSAGGYGLLADCHEGRGSMQACAASVALDFPPTANGRPFARNPGHVTR
jgi:hypothetical protein